MRVLFVCLGNICRSPTAEGVFRHRAQQAAIRTMYKGIAAPEGREGIGGCQSKFVFIQFAPGAGKHFLPCRLQALPRGIIP